MDMEEAVLFRDDIELPTPDDCGCLAAQVRESDMPTESQIPFSDLGPLWECLV